MANQTRRRTEIERLLTQREAEGLTFKALAERSGVPIGTLSYWSYKLRRESATGGNRRAFVELVERPTVAARAHAAARVRVEHPSGMVIEFEGSAVAAALDRLLPIGGAPWS